MGRKIVKIYDFLLKIPIDPNFVLNTRKNFPMEEKMMNKIKEYRTLHKKCKWCKYYKYYLYPHWLTLGYGKCLLKDKEDVKQKVESIPEISKLDLNLVFEPEWSQDLMTEEAKLELGFL